MNSPLNKLQQKKERFGEKLLNFYKTALLKIIDKTLKSSCF